MKETSGDLPLSQKQKNLVGDRIDQTEMDGREMPGSSLGAAMKSPSEGSCQGDSVALPLNI